MGLQKILVIEDSPESFELIRSALVNMADLTWANSIRTGAALLNTESFDLILLDLGLPDGDGFSFCSLLHTSDLYSRIPVILITARSTIADKVMGFSVGAEDYVCKPFAREELRSRIEAKLRRLSYRRAQTAVIRMNGIEVNKDSQRAFLSDNGVERELQLTALEFKILVLLMSKPNQVISRDEILNTIWGENVFVYERIVDTHVSKLRKKLGAAARFLESVHGSGYRYISENDSKPNLLNGFHHHQQIQPM